MCSLRDHEPEIAAHGAVLLGISVQDQASKQKFAAQNHLNFPILADADKSASRAYGVLAPNGYDQRVTFTIGPDGRFTNIDRTQRFAKTATGFTSVQGAVSAMLVAGKWKVAIGGPVPAFTLKDASGAAITVPDGKHRATVIIFYSNRCPVARDYASRITTLAADYGPKHVEFVTINADSRAQAAQLSACTQQMGYPEPVLLDPRGAMASRFGATHTPEAWVIDGFGNARYHGAIDDSVDASTVRERYVANALDALLSGKAPAVVRTALTGCVIKKG